MTIRHVTTADAGAWGRMREALWPGDPHAADIAAFFAGSAPEPEAVLVAEREPGVPVAVIELSVRRDLPGTEGALTGYVEGLYVEPAQRSVGTARRLLRAAQGWARARGCTFFASDRDERIIFDPAYRAAQPSARANASCEQRQSRGPRAHAVVGIAQLASVRPAEPHPSTASPNPPSPSTASRACSPAARTPAACCLLPRGRHRAAPSPARRWGPSCRGSCPPCPPMPPTWSCPPT